MKLSFWERMSVITSGPFLLGTLTVVTAWAMRGFKSRPREKNSRPNPPDSA